MGLRNQKRRKEPLALRAEGDRAREGRVGPLGLLLPEAGRHLGLADGGPSCHSWAWTSSGKALQGQRKAPFLVGKEEILSWEELHFTTVLDVLEAEVPEAELCTAPDSGLHCPSGCGPTFSCTLNHPHHGTTASAGPRGPA